MIDRVLLRSLIPLNPPDGFLKPQTQQLSPLEFIARLTTHIPGHYERLIHYYGVYSSRSLGAGRAKAPGAEREVAREKPPPTHSSRQWQQLLQRNGDILVWNHVTNRRHELTSMGIRVTRESLIKQMQMAGLQDDLQLPYHQAIINDEIPLSIGGGIGQSRTYMLMLRKAHIGEVSVTVWPKRLKEICAKKNIHVLE